MSRGGLERVSEDELIVLVLKLQRPAKTSRTSSKPPCTDPKERRGQSRPGGAKPGHEGHSPVIAEDPDTVFDHCPTACSDCGLALSADMQAQTVSVHEQIELPEVKPLVEQHRRLSVVCPGCSARVPALRPTGAVSTPFGPRLHATAAYLKTFQALSYERLHEALFDLFGRRNSQGGPTKMLRRAETRFEAGSDAALSALRRATVGGVRRDRRRIQGTNSSHWVFRGEEAVVHHAAPTRGACVLHEIMDGHRPAVWLSDRYSAQQGHADRQQTCLAHLARDVVDALDVGDDTLALRLKLWVDGAFALARTITRSAPSTAATKRSRLERSLDDILVASAACDPARDIPSRMARARDQLLTFASFPGRVEAHKNACKRDLRLAVIQRKNTNGYRAMWSAKGEAAVRTVVATARMTSGASTFTIVLGTIGV